MKKISLIIACLTLAFSAIAQQTKFKSLTNIAVTPVKSQGQTGTCWNYSTISMIESEGIRKGVSDMDLSEMFSTRNVYIEKAKNYILRQGKAQFSEGGLGHDLIHAIAKYGAMPQEAFQGAQGAIPDHSGLEQMLKAYLDRVLEKKPVKSNWLDGYVKILDEKIGVPPVSFIYKGKTYTAPNFAKEVLKFNPDDYVNISSFTHHPYFRSFVLEVPDNFSNGTYYNLPLEDMISMTKSALNSGYSIMWDADISNENFQQDKGYAMLFEQNADFRSNVINPAARELTYTADMRQQLYEELTTQDDHLMHLVGIDQSSDGKVFFKVKNSWGEVGPFKGFIEVSEPYFAVNTISLVVPKAALSKALLAKLGL